MIFSVTDLDNVELWGEITSLLKKRGFLVIKNFLSSEKVKEIKEVMQHSNSSHDFLETILLSNNDEKEILHTNLFKIIENEKNIKTIDEILQTLKYGAHLTRIDSYKSKKSKKPILEWHNDRAFSGEKIIHNRVQNRLFSYKLFIHITETQKNNGSFSYLPNSNRISTLIRKAFRDGIIEYSPFWKLVDFSNILKRKEIIDFVDSCFLELKKEIKNFLRVSENLIINPNSNKYSIPCKQGDAILFDERGFHQGGVPSKSERIVLRLFYLNGAGKYKPEPITEYGRNQLNNPVGTFQSPIN